MKTILIIADQSPEAEHAVAFALIIAQAVHADVLIADTVLSNRISSNAPVMAGRDNEPAQEAHCFTSEQLKTMIDPEEAYIPTIREVDISDYHITDLIAMVNKSEIWLLVEGMPDTLDKADGDLKLNIQSVLNRVRCPLLLIPQSWKLKKPERIVYLADLRYCRRFVLKFLSALAAPFDAGISIAHLSAKGLTDIVDSYAASIFQNDVLPQAHYEKMTLNNTRERNIHKAVDLMINVMKNDLMVLVNHRYHFEELIGRHIGDVLPADITIPVLIFPL
jgi:hypothetical protein